MILQLRPFLMVWETRTHVPGFKPGIAPALAAVRPHLTGRTFVPVARVRLVDGLLENFPAFFHRAAAEIIAWNREGGAKIHLAVGGDRKSTLAAGAFDEGLLSRTRCFGFVHAPVWEQLLVDSDFLLGGKPILQRRPIPGDAGHDLQAILELHVQGFHQLPTGLDLFIVDGGHRHPDDDRQRGRGKIEQALSKLPIGAWNRSHLFIDRFCRAIYGDVDLTDTRLMEEVGERWCDAGSVGHEVSHQSLPPRMSQDVTDVRAHAWLATGEGDGEYPKISDLVQERANLIGRKFMGQGAMGGVVAMDAA